MTKHARWWSSFVDAIQGAYWTLVPYDWRPGRIWYRLKCWVWHRYTTVKPRTLPWHTWTDRDVLLAHVMFEVLGQFIEGECPPGSVDWDANAEHAKGHRELQDLWDWWRNVYVAIDVRDPHMKGVKHPVLARVPTGRTHPEFGELFGLEFKHESPGDKETWQAACRNAADAEVAMHAELKSRLHRLIDVMDFMWT